MGLQGQLRLRRRHDRQRHLPAEVLERDGSGSHSVTEIRIGRLRERDQGVEKGRPSGRPFFRAYARSVAFYITTPIFYVNAEPHLGHAYSTIAADVFARHMRQRGEDVFFLTGTDEHGEPVELAAEREGISPQELADRNAPRFQAMAESVNASNDFFIRTSDTRHTDRVADVIQRVYDSGHVYEGTYEGLVLPAVRRLQDRARARAWQHLPDPRDPARARDRAELVLSPLLLSGPPDRAVRAGAAVRRAGLPAKRSALVHPARAR